MRCQPGARVSRVRPRRPRKPCCAGLALRAAGAARRRRRDARRRQPPLRGEPAQLFTGLDLETVVQGTTTEEQTVHTALDGAYLDGSYYELQRGTERAARLDWGAPAEDVQDALNTLTLTDARVDIIPVGVNPSFQPDYIIRSSCWTAPTARYRGASPSTTRAVHCCPSRCGANPARKPAGTDSSTPAPCCEGSAPRAPATSRRLPSSTSATEGAAHHALLGSYDGYTYPPGAGNLDSITYDTSSLQGTTPAVVNEVLRTGSTPFSGTFSVAFNGAKTEEMEWQEAADEVEYVIEKLDTIGEIRVDRTDMGLQRIPGVTATSASTARRRRSGDVVTGLDDATAETSVGAVWTYYDAADDGAIVLVASSNDGFGVFRLDTPFAVPGACWNSGDDVDDHVACADSGASGYAPVAIAYVVAADAAASNDGMNCPSCAPRATTPTVRCADLASGTYGFLFALDYFDGDAVNGAGLSRSAAPPTRWRPSTTGSAASTATGPSASTGADDPNVAAVVGTTYYYKSPGKNDKSFYFVENVHTDDPVFVDDAAFVVSPDLFSSSLGDVVVVVRLDADGRYPEAYAVLASAVDWARITRRPDDSAFGAGFGYELDTGENQVFFANNDGFGIFEVELPLAVPSTCWNAGSLTAFRACSATAAVLRLWDDAAGAYEDDYAVASVNIWQGTFDVLYHMTYASRVNAVDLPFSDNHDEYVVAEIIFAATAEQAPLAPYRCNVSSPRAHDAVACSILDGNQPGGSTKLEYE
ncbi:hypothetical protein JL720_6412 [Aureococcus anophagefferens]|nr:hypothetical protein JL720_6412 [Aureococcus anophagefferens]